MYYAHVFNNSRESLDHILVSQEFYDNSKKRLWAFKGMELTNDHVNTPPAKAGGFRLRLKAGLIGPSADDRHTTVKSSSGSGGF